MCNTLCRMSSVCCAVLNEILDTAQTNSFRENVIKGRSSARKSEESKNKQQQIKRKNEMKKTKNKRMSKRTNERMNEPNHIVSNYKNCLIDLFVYISPYRRWNMMESVVMPKYIHIRV